MDEAAFVDVKRLGIEADAKVSHCYTICHAVNKRVDRKWLEMQYSTRSHESLTSEEFSKLILHHPKWTSHNIETVI